MNDRTSPLLIPKPEALTGWVPPVDVALDLARKTLAEHAEANIHNNTAMLRAAADLGYVLRDLIAALDKEAGR